MSPSIVTDGITCLNHYYAYHHLHSSVTFAVILDGSNAELSVPTRLSLFDKSSLPSVSSFIDFELSPLA